MSLNTCAQVTLQFMVILSELETLWLHLNYSQAEQGRGSFVELVSSNV